ncbi:ketosteroid isomerase-like protein [Herbihabitans rhizosphaerae]|uniref:Ketosteroid isomerase-like protein n=1 Tax=Herbihabitans rhizosphaerae TaxID=1872711 RepID=A0A4Q7L3J7_9PSEU|nr:nuclear transport factor 2 family protein [Herbihabitans rhizosphaerae]RZS43815.1 ketosteroid isomerase-like protein [Herbihabitans rhizosphaerae]
MELTTEAARHPHVFERAFNTGRIELVDQLYEPDGVLVADGEQLTGRRRADALRAHLDLGAPVRVNPRQVHVSGDIALLIVDWAIEGHIGGTATDVVRRGPDGFWRYVIDNPMGSTMAA